MTSRWSRYGIMWSSPFGSARRSITRSARPRLTDRTRALAAMISGAWRLPSAVSSARWSSTTPGRPRCRSKASTMLVGFTDLFGRADHRQHDPGQAGHDAPPPDRRRAARCPAGRTPRRRPGRPRRSPPDPRPSRRPSASRGRSPRGPARPRRRPSVQASSIARSSRADTRTHERRIASRATCTPYGPVPGGG